MRNKIAKSVFFRIPVEVFTDNAHFRITKFSQYLKTSPAGRDMPLGKISDKIQGRKRSDSAGQSPHNGASFCANGQTV